MINQERGTILYVAPNGNDKDTGTLERPLATPMAALARLNRMKGNGLLRLPATIFMREGMYPISEPMIIGPKDSLPVTIAAFPGERPIIDGGMRIGDWAMGEVNGRKAWISHIPAVREGKLHFKQLFVNGTRRERATLPKKGFFQMESVPGMKEPRAELFAGSDRFVAAPGDFRAFRNPSDVDVMVYHYWTDERMSLSSYDEATRTVVSRRRSIFALTDDFEPRYAKYAVENVFEGLTEPGEWYLDRSEGNLYYIPMDGEKPGETLVVAPVTRQFLRLEGDAASNSFVEYITFKGISFAYSEWDYTTSAGKGFGSKGVEYASSPQAAFNVPGAVYLQGARYCSFEDCLIDHAGTYGIEIADGCRGIRVQGCELSDLGAGGIKLNGAAADEPEALRTGNNSITDNHIHHCGRVFRAGVGILSVHSHGNDMSHNHIHDLYYSGISCGWVWGFGANASRDNRIERNHIHHLGFGLLSDMGGVYTLGVQPGTVVKGNLIHDIEKANYGGWGIYPDEGSTGIVYEDNIVYNTSSQPFNQHYGHENTVRNNIFAFGREGQVSLGKYDGTNAFTFTNNIVLTNGTPAFVTGYGAKLSQGPFRSDLNLLWDYSGREPLSGDGPHLSDGVCELANPVPLGEWLGMGYDNHSVVADPEFADPLNGDFRLADDSVALSIGFKPIDMSDVGPRKAEGK